MTDHNADVNSRIDRIEVTLDHAVDAIEKMAEAFGNKKTDWSALAAWATILMGIGTAVYWPVNNAVTENGKNITELAKQIGDMREKHWTADEQAKFDQRIRDDIDRLEDRVWDQHKQGQ